MLKYFGKVFVRKVIIFLLLVNFFGDFINFLNYLGDFIVICIILSC